MNRLARAAFLAAAATVIAVLTPAGALAAVTPAGPTQTVTLAVTPADRAAVASLAQAKGLPRSARAAYARALAPSATLHGAIRAAVADLGLGLTVVNETAFTVTLSGSAQAIRAAFGSARSVAPTSRFGHALPHLPAELISLVTAAFGGDETRPHYRAHAQQPLEGTDVRAAYNVPFGSTPARPTTIATLQFSGWDHSNLTHYATARGLPDPVLSGQYTPVLIDGRPETKTVLDGGGDFEVTLDQEALLGTAPKANQRAYITNNTDTGELDALARIHQDAIDATHNGYGLVALSVSWGVCEKLATSVQAIRDAYAQILADGLTIFTSAGDAGAFDCSVNTLGQADNSPAVDTPSSFPEAVSVGGTTLLTNGTLTRTDDTETVWANSAVTKQDPNYRGDGGGGGVSQLIARPTWQSGITGFDPTHRLVPDIAAVADVNTGYALYWNDGTGGTNYLGGGTSLAAPLSAAMFTDSLIERGISTGIGDIHTALYSAPASTFRDITSGDNSFGFVPGNAAHPGYDLSSGLGSPDWTALSAGLGTINDTTPPVASATAALAYGANLSFSWSATDAAPSSGIAGYDVTISHTVPGSVNTVDFVDHATTSTTHLMSGLMGPSYTLSVVAFDRAGNRSAVVSRRVDVPIDDSRFSYTSGWTHPAATNDYGGAAHLSTIRSASAYVSPSFRSLSAWFVFSSYGGQVQVLVDGHLIKTVDTYTTGTRYRVPVPIITFPTTAFHTVRFYVLGTKQAASKSAQVLLDAVACASY